MNNIGQMLSFSPESTSEQPDNSKDLEFILSSEWLTINSPISPADPELRRAIFEIHQWRCYYTRDEITLETMHIEHIHARSRWWKDCIANYFPAVPSINLMKANNYDEWSVSCLLSINKLVFAPRVLKRYIELKGKRLKNPMRKNKRSLWYVMNETVDTNL